MLPEDRDEIDEQDIEDVKISAREVSIPAQMPFCIRSSSITMSMGKTACLIRSECLGKNWRPIFISSTAWRTRIQNTIRCVKELPLGCRGCGFGALASAQVVLTPHQKDLGALVIDIGGGTSDSFYTLMAWSSKAVASQVAATISQMTFRWACAFQWARAEKLKIERAAASSEIVFLAKQLY
jgi:cell division protein FtsA